jgi:hypothetical protein
MSSPNGSIANLFVTCKSLFTGNLRRGFPVPFLSLDDSIKTTRTQTKSRRWNGAGVGLKDVVPPRSAARESAG